MDKALFSYLMISNSEDSYKMSKFLGISLTSFNERRRNKIPFKLDEIKRIGERWNLTPEQIYDLFIKEA